MVAGQRDEVIQGARITDKLNANLPSALRTRVTELEQERDALKTELSRQVEKHTDTIEAYAALEKKYQTAKAELAPYKSTICELLDEIKAMAHELAELRAEVERLKAKLGGPDYLLKLDTYEDTVRELMHELAVRERQAEILDEEWDGRHTVESALAQARAELAKETTLARVDEIEEAYHSADDSKLVFKEAKS